MSNVKASERDIFVDITPYYGGDIILSRFVDCKNIINIALKLDIDEDQYALFYIDNFGKPQFVAENQDMVSELCFETNRFFNGERCARLGEEDYLLMGYQDGVAESEYFIDSLIERIDNLLEKMQRAEGFLEETKALMAYRENLMSLEYEGE
jgi:hypothetical protein